MSTSIPLDGDWTYLDFESDIHPVAETRHYYTHRIPLEFVPALEPLRERLESAGYTFDHEPVRVVRCKRDTAGIGESVLYAVEHTARFEKGDVNLLVSAEGEGDTLEEAAGAATARVSALLYTGEPVRGGQGRSERCRQLALRLYDEHAEALFPDSLIIVPYRTSGSGSRLLVARRKFTLNELG